MARSWPVASAMMPLDRGEGPPLVCVVDDDLSLLRGLRRLLGAYGFTVEPFPSAEAFLASPHRERTACLVLDVQLSGLTGIELQEQLLAAGSRIPVIFITGHDDQPTRERAQRAQAFAYLRKPFDDQVLIEAVNKALGRG
jgi:FixJ family two-component response regulator